MMKRLLKKMKNRAGETITETLVALLIAALALVMLAGAIASSSNVIDRGRRKLDEYYETADTDVVNRTSGVSVSDGISITDTTNAISKQSYDIMYYGNDKFGNTPVIAYQYTPASGG